MGEIPFRLVNTQLEVRRLQQLRVQGTVDEKEQKDRSRRKDGRDHKTRPFNQHEHISYELIEYEETCTGPSQDCTTFSTYI